MAKRSSSRARKTRCYENCSGSARAAKCLKSNGATSCPYFASAALAWTTPISPRGRRASNSRLCSNAHAKRKAPHCRGSSAALLVHEEGLEPPHLAVPEPKSGSEVPKCCQLSRSSDFENPFATFGSNWRPKWTIRERLPLAVRSQEAAAEV